MAGRISNAVAPDPEFAKPNAGRVPDILSGEHVATDADAAATTQSAIKYLRSRTTNRPAAVTQHLGAGIHKDHPLAADE
jgi:hypothetical protein